MQWHCKHFNELTAQEIYSILQIRSAVFVVEQNCVYQDVDDKDTNAYHLFAIINQEIVAYARLLAPGISYTEASIGRVLTAPKHRQYGYGKILMQHAITRTQQLFNVESIKIGAQFYLLQFYNSLGFVQTSDLYDEDGIDHIEMKWIATQ
ncbi:GNAT family N-acetyltransferase [Ferruginibacter yonginensis]|uniref:GNAT family N-acetyltransferase n=1 Tax=Ferruginibacter yonginensis TaxID=1310416 RepID=A0ABV8QTI8_9BACT